MNNCLCNIFDEKTLWIIIIALLVIFCCGNGNGCGSAYGNNGCGNGYNNGCGC